MNILKKEILGILYSTKGKIVLSIILILPQIDAMLSYQIISKGAGGVHPSMAAFLSGYSGHIVQMLLMWLLPLYGLLMYGEQAVLEKKNGYEPIIMVRENKKKIYLSKIAAGFVSMFSAIMITLILNYVICLVLFFGGNRFKGLENYVATMDGWMLFSMRNPIIAYIVHIIVTSMIAGFVGALCVALSTIISNLKMLYGVCFIIWFAQIIQNYSITYAMQPFIEYDLDYIIPALLILLGVTMGCILVGYIKKVKVDNI